MPFINFKEKIMRFIWLDRADIEPAGNINFTVFLHIVVF